MPNRSELSPFSDLAKVSLATAAGLVAFFIALSNIFVFFLVFFDRKLRNARQNWLLFSLSVADLCIGAYPLPIFVLYRLQGVWNLGPVFCRIWLSSKVFFITASVVNISAISLDRFWSVRRPLSHPIRRTPGRTITTIIILWLIPTLICAPSLLLPNTARHNTTCEHRKDFGYGIFWICSGFLLPYGLMLVAYIRVYQLGRKQWRMRRSRSKKLGKMIDSGGKKSRQMEQQGTVPQQDHKPIQFLSSDTAYYRAVRVCEAVPHSMASKKKMRRKAISLESINTADVAIKISVEMPSLASMASNDELDSESTQEIQSNFQKHAEQMSQVQGRIEASNSFRRKYESYKHRDFTAALTVAIILTVFTVCWLPFFTFSTLRILGVSISENVLDISLCLGFCNSGINPLIYSICNKDFRLVLGRIWNAFKMRITV